MNRNQARIASIIWGSLPDTAWFSIGLSDVNQASVDGNSVFFEGVHVSGHLQVPVLVGVEFEGKSINHARVICGGLEGRINVGSSRFHSYNTNAINELLSSAVQLEANKLATNREVRKKEPLMLTMADFDTQVNEVIAQVEDAKMVYSNRKDEVEALRRSYVDRMREKYEDHSLQYIMAHVPGVPDPVICLAGVTREFPSLNGEVKEFICSFSKEGGVVWVHFPLGVNMITTMPPEYVKPNNKGMKPFHNAAVVGDQRIYISKHLDDCIDICRKIEHEAPDMDVDWRSMMLQIEQSYHHDVVAKAISMLKE